MSDAVDTIEQKCLAKGVKLTEQRRIIAKVMSGSPAQSDFQPPSMVFNGLAIKDNYLYISGELERSLFRISL